MESNRKLVHSIDGLAICAILRSPRPYQNTKQKSSSAASPLTAQHLVSWNYTSKKTQFHVIANKALS